MSPKKGPVKVKSKGKASTTAKPLPGGYEVLWLLLPAFITAIVFIPMLSNGFTNWDDQRYVTENAMLTGPDWKAILSSPVVSNYHPLTMLSLALNYQLSALDPFSYHMVNWILHILNTVLVAFLAFKLSSGNRWVGIITALFFGIHPMHVESVAWISERKDVLYTFFFLLALLYYHKYIGERNRKNYLIVLLCFSASLLSKPSAVTLPIILLLMDWYQGRSLREKGLWLEKIPFFLLAMLFGILTLIYQAEEAIANPEYYPLWQKLVFAVYGFGEYFRRLFWPFPLSTIHPFPDQGIVPAAYYPSIFLSLCVIGFTWYFRRNKYLLFGVAFYTINLILVLQVLAFGNSVISERYTYVPYFGLVFALAMLWAKSNLTSKWKNALLTLFVFAGLAFCLVTYKQVQVWHDSMTLWTKAIDVYPRSYVARANRGNYLITDLKAYDEGLIDYNIALEVMPDHINSLENRAIIFLHKENYQAALTDAEMFVKYHPDLPRGYFLKAFTLDRLGRADEAIAEYSRSIALDPKNAEPLANRGIIFYNSKKDYVSAKADFDAAILLDPSKGEPFLNRARCWIKSGNKAEALKDLETARQLGTVVGEEVMQAAQALP